MLSQMILSIADQEFESDAEFHAFHCHVLHTCLSVALEPMKSAM